MHRTAVQFLGRVIAITEVRSSSGFIAQTPENHTRMITVSQYHPVNTVYKRRYPGRHVTDRLVGMVFQVSLIHRVQAIVIKHGIHFSGIRIMRRTNRIDVVPLHGQHIPQHGLRRHSPSVHRMRIMPVGSLKEYPLAIQIKQRALHFDVTETVFRRKGHFVLSSLTLYHLHSIQCRSFSSPQRQICQIE